MDLGCLTWQLKDEDFHEGKKEENLFQVARTLRMNIALCDAWHRGTVNKYCFFPWMEDTAWAHLAGVRKG